MGWDLVHFKKGERKDDVAHRYLSAAAGPDGTVPEGILFIGRAQEKKRVFRTQKRRNPVTGASYLWIVRDTAMINHFYFYCFDDDFGPFFVKFCSYFPYTGKICINGHHWAQRQATKAGVTFTAMDNAFAAVDDAACASDLRRLGAPQIQSLTVSGCDPAEPVHRADNDPGYRYELSILQAEFSLTQMLDHPVSGRVFFEQVIRDNLDIGRPDKVSLIFDRRFHRRTQAADAGPVPHPGDHRRGHPEPARRLQARHDQAVPQVATRGRTLRVDSQAGGPTDVGGVVPGQCSMARARPDVRRR